MQSEAIQCARVHKALAGNGARETRIDRRGNGEQYEQ